jgi:hypothetical protein
LDAALAETGVDASCSDWEHSGSDSFPPEDELGLKKGTILKKFKPSSSSSEAEIH